MKHWPPAPPRAPRAPRRRRIPAFHPVPVNARHDGWTVERQADFIGTLAETRSVLAAARAVSMSRESAYRLRRRPGAAGFAAAWDIALGHAETTPQRPRAKVTGPPTGYCIEAGLIQVIMFAGRYRCFTRKTDSSRLIQHLSALDRACRDVDEDAVWSQIFSGGIASTGRRSLQPR